MTTDLITFDQRPSSEGPIQTVWRSASNEAGSFISAAYSTWELVFWNIAGIAGTSLRGPETVATHAQVPADGRWLGIRFRTGVVLPGVNHFASCDRTLELPMLDARHFRLAGQTYEVPTFDNADCLVAQLVRRGRLALDHHVLSSLHAETSTGREAKATQRRFRSATGLNRRSVKTIERARKAASMLLDGRTIGDTIDAVGYCDQPHLTRSLTRLIGLTPMALMRPAAPQLSFLERVDSGV
jgi:AraC-like DNA-binding protein